MSVMYFCSTRKGETCVEEAMTESGELDSSLPDDSFWDIVQAVEVL